MPLFLNTLFYAASGKFEYCGNSSIATPSGFCFLEAVWNYLFHENLNFFFNFFIYFRIVLTMICKNKKILIKNILKNNPRSDTQIDF
jgi:hypothetical protein